MAVFLSPKGVSQIMSHILTGLSARRIRQHHEKAVHDDGITQEPQLQTRDSECKVSPSCSPLFSYQTRTYLKHSWWASSHSCTTKCACNQKSESQLLGLPLSVFNPSRMLDAWLRDITDRSTRLRLSSVTFLRRF